MFVLFILTLTLNGHPPQYLAAPMPSMAACQEMVAVMTAMSQTIDGEIIVDCELTMLPKEVRPRGFG